MHDKILKEIETRKEIYQTSPYDMVAAYNREIETEKEYNGRQLLELLQNADDEKSDEVLIKLDTQQKTLQILNRGINCIPFSFKGIRSLMISNLSSKTNKKFIGNKGLGFRSIINWSEKIIINSNDLDIVFSRDTVDDIYDELFDRDIQRKIREERELPPSIKPIPFLSIPKVSQNKQSEWVTTVAILYKDKYQNDIKKQIGDLRKEILLFLNHLKTLVVIVDDDIVLEVDKDSLLQEWNIFQRKEQLPREFWDKDNEAEYYDLKLALQDNLENNIKELFSYFPTKIDINLPYIVHGTFELNSSRNEINDSKKNRYILKELVHLIIDTAKELTKQEVSYKAIEMLSFTSKNNVLESLGFYEAIDEAIDVLEIFPCLDSAYRSMDDVVFEDELSSFVYNTSYDVYFPNLLIPLPEHISLDNFSLSSTIEREKFILLSEMIKDIKTRVDYIYILASIYTDDNKLPILVDENGELIGLDDDVYTPSNQDFSIPKYVKIKFIHKELFGRLIGKFNLKSTDNKPREIQRKLKEITNIQSYEPAPVLQKIVTTTNKVLNQNGIDTKTIIKQMVQSLYENFILLDKTTIPNDTKIQLLNKDESLSDAKDLFLSVTYPSGEITETLFRDVFANKEFLANISVYGLENEPIEDVEMLFLWLGVNKISKLIPTSKFDKQSYCRKYFTLISGKPDYAHHMTIGNVHTIYKLDEISKNITLEKFVLWCIKDEHIYESFIEKIQVMLRGSRGGYINTRHSDISFIYHKLLSLNVFKDYLIGNEKISQLVNEYQFNFQYREFEKYNINKADIESMLLKIGATDKFEKLSIDAVSKVVHSLPKKTPEGKQAQSIYKLCIKHFERNKLPLNNSNIAMFFAKKENQKRYYNAKEVFYNGNIKLPKNITNTKAILDYPRRQNTKHVVDFFGINNLKEIEIIILQKELDKVLTTKFNQLLNQIKEYILVYRLKDIEKDKVAEEELRKLQNMEISLCSSVHYRQDEKEHELENNDYIKDGQEYLIKINPSKPLHDIIHDSSGFEFQESFADIVGLVFDIQDTQVFRNMIKEDTLYIEKTIRNDIGSDVLIRARELLGKSDEKLSFWKTVYTLIGEEFKYTSSDDLLSSIADELELIAQTDTLDYLHLSSYQDCVVITQLFKELDITIENFNNKEPFYKIDSTQYNQVNIKQAFENHSKKFQRLLYSYCLEQQKEKDFNDLKALYNKNDSYCLQQAEHYKYSSDINNNEIIQQYIREHFEFDGVDETSIDFQSVYNQNISKIDVDELNGNSDYLSLLYFENGLKEILQYLEKEHNLVVKDEGKVNNFGCSVLKPIIDAELKNSSDILNHQDSVKKASGARKHNNKSDKQKQKIGRTSEQEVCDSLVMEDGVEDVEQVSNDDDSLGYDIRYKDKDGLYRYAEVKTFFSNQFYLTKNEKEFALANIGFYELFLVSTNEIFRLKDVDFTDKDKFILVENEYIVKLTIQK